MILTLTPNPSLDRTAHVRGTLERGYMHRLHDVIIEPGGKGINLVRSVHLAGKETLAVFPASPREQILTLLEMRGIPFSAIDVNSSVRTNLTVIEPNGITTKLNEPGGELTPAEVNSLIAAFLVAAERATWVVLSGSLPPGVPDDFYVDLVRSLRQLPVKIVLDTSDAPLVACARAWPNAVPDLFTPNTNELSQASKMRRKTIQDAIDQNDYSLVLEALTVVRDRGVPAVLATHGAAGATYACEDGIFLARSPEIEVRNRAGAGDSAIAGFLLACKAGDSPEDCLRNAVAYGAAATSLDGASVPTPEQTDPESVEVVRLQ